MIIIGFLNHRDGVYFNGPCIGRVGSVSSSKIIGSSNTDGEFCTCGLSTVVLLCLLVSGFSFSLSTLSTSALIVGCNLGGGICLTLLDWLLIFTSLFDRGVSYQWGAASTLELGERPTLELNEISPSEAWCFARRGEGSIHGVFSLVFSHGFWVQHKFLLVLWGLMMFGQQVIWWSQYLMLLVS